MHIPDTSTNQIFILCTQINLFNKQVLANVNLKSSKRLTMVLKEILEPEIGNGKLIFAALKMSIAAI